MNKEEYLKLKALRETNFENEARRNLCFTCYKTEQSCLCHHLRPFSPKAKIILLMHPMEAKKERVGTGRLTLATLANSDKIIDIDFTHNKQINELLNNPENECFLLYPGANTINVSTATNKFSTPKKQMVIFVIDGTWPCAKKMMRLSKNLHNLPRVSFNNDKISGFHIKQQPDKLCLSTIESIYTLLDELKRLGEESFENEHHALIDIFNKMVEYQVDCANDPMKPAYRKKGAYSKPESRKPNRGSRHIIFDTDS